MIVLLRRWFAFGLLVLSSLGVPLALLVEENEPLIVYWMLGSLPICGLVGEPEVPNELSPILAFG